MSYAPTAKDDPYGCAAFLDSICQDLRDNNIPKVSDFSGKESRDHTHDAATGSTTVHPVTLA